MPEVTNAKIKIDKSFLRAFYSNTQIMQFLNAIEKGLLKVDARDVNLIEEDPIFQAWLAGPPNLSEFFDDIGASTTGDTYTSGGSIGGQRLVMVSGGKVVYFDQSVEANYGKAIGFTQTASVLDDPVQVQHSGILSGFGGLVADTLYYAADTGLITATPPLTGMVIPVGVALSATELAISIVNEFITI
jgi:hypothetical protein